MTTDCTDVQCAPYLVDSHGFLLSGRACAGIAVFSMRIAARLGWPATRRRRLPGPEALDDLASFLERAGSATAGPASS